MNSSYSALFAVGWLLYGRAYYVLGFYNCMLVCRNPRFFLSLLLSVLLLCGIKTSVLIFCSTCGPSCKRYRVLYASVWEDEQPKVTSVIHPPTPPHPRTELLRQTHSAFQSDSEDVFFKHKKRTISQISFIYRQARRTCMKCACSAFFSSLIWNKGNKKNTEKGLILFACV